jgi:hypothetical protein
MAILTPQFNIQIKTQAGKTYRIPVIESIRINTSRKPEADTATVKIPSIRGLYLDTFKKGDEISIWFGHKESDYGFEKVFLGTITRVGPNFPMTIEAKDWWWNIKKAWHKDKDAKLVSASLNSIAQTLLTNAGDGAKGLEGVELITSTDYETVLFKEEFPIGNRSYGEIFSKLLEHGWDLFMLPGTKKLWFGPRNNITIHYQPAINRTPIFQSGLNIIDSDLTHEDSSGIRKVEIRVASKDRKSKDADGDFPKLDDSGNLIDGSFKGWDNNGDTIKLEIPGLDKTIPAGDIGSPDWYAKLLYDVKSKQGLSGHFRTFGQGYYHHWMKCKLEIRLYTSTISYTIIDQHHFPSGIDYIYSPSDGFRMDVNFENAHSGEVA